MVVKRRYARVLTLLVLATLVACGSTPQETPGTPTTAPVATSAPTAEPTLSAPPPAVNPAQQAMEYVERLEGQTLAVVNGEEISWEDYEPVLRQALFSLSQQYGLDWTDAAMKQRLAYVQNDVLHQAVDRWLLRQMADDQGVAVDPADLEAEIESQKSQILATDQYGTWDEFLAANGFSDGSFQQMIHDTLLLSAFLTLQDVERQGPQVRIAHIAAGDEARAEEVAGKLRGGETFEAVAAEYSLDEQTKDSGGELGWASEGMLQPELEQALSSLEPGQFSEPISTPQGYVILKLLERAVRDLDPRAIMQSQQQALMLQVQAMRDSAEIEYLVDFAQE